MEQPGKQQAKSQRAQEAICEAAIKSLHEVGYGETSLNKVAAMAGFSKGALQHHFPSKEDLIAATVDRLLNRAISDHKPSTSLRSVEAEMLWSWKKMVDTKQYRALLEVLNAARTDTKLEHRISGDLLAWGRALDQQAIDKYQAVDGDEQDVRALMRMTRSFMRGLVIEEQYAQDTSENLDQINRWIGLVAPLLKLKK